MNTIYSLLRIERINRKMSQTDVAIALTDLGCDMSSATISRIENGLDPSWSTLVGYCRLFGYTLTDFEKKLKGGESGPPIVGQHVNVVNWVNAANWNDNPDIAFYDQERVFVSGILPKGTFALRVTGDSMTSNIAEESFPDGSLILINPNKEPKPKDFVIAFDESINEATFKQLVSDCGKMYLKPLNPQYPVLNFKKNIIIKGVVFRRINDKILA